MHGRPEQLDGLDAVHHRWYPTPVLEGEIRPVGGDDLLGEPSHERRHVLPGIAGQRTDRPGDAAGPRNRIGHGARLDVPPHQRQRRAWVHQTGQRRG